MKQFFGFLFMLLPLAICLGYDLHHHYQFPDEPFFSDLGWLWQHYSQASHDYMYKVIGPDAWKRYMLPILMSKAVFVGGIASGAMISLYVISKIFHAAARSKFSTNVKRSHMSLGRARADQRSKPFEYKRK